MNASSPWHGRLARVRHAQGSEATYGKRSFHAPMGGTPMPRNTGKRVIQKNLVPAMLPYALR